MSGGVGANYNAPVPVKALDPRLKHRHLVDVNCGLFKGRFEGWECCVSC